jgi:DNA-binding response OmpR family regulator
LRVLIVQDSAAGAVQLVSALAGEGMATEVALSGSQAIAAKRRLRPDVALVDLGLPDMDGLALVQLFARDGDCGIIVVSGTAAEGAQVAGLDTGADDFILKPPPLKELAARIRAVHRRLTRPLSLATVRTLPVTLDWAHRRLAGPGELTTKLTEAEFAALSTLLEADGASVSRDLLGRVALKRSLGPDDRSVDQLVLKLRRKLALHGVADRSILSSRGLGYVIPDPGRFVVDTMAQEGDAADGSTGRD